MLQDRLIITQLAAPKALEQSANVTSSYSDMSGRNYFSFLVQLGVVAQSKKVTIELLGSNKSSGADAKTIATHEYTAPSGGVTGHLVVIRGKLKPDYRYMAVKITNNDSSAGTVAAVTLVSSFMYVPDDGDNTVVSV